MAKKKYIYEKIEPEDDLYRPLIAESRIYKAEDNSPILEIIIPNIYTPQRSDYIKEVFKDAIIKNHTVKITATGKYDINVNILNVVQGKEYNSGERESYPFMNEETWKEVDELTGKLDREKTEQDKLYEAGRKRSKTAAKNKEIAKKRKKDAAATKILAAAAKENLSGLEELPSINFAEKEKTQKEKAEIAEIDSVNVLAEGDSCIVDEIKIDYIKRTIRNVERDNFVATFNIDHCSSLEEQFLNDLFKKVGVDSKVERPKYPSLKGREASFKIWGIRNISRFIDSSPDAIYEMPTFNKEIRQVMEIATHVPCLQALDEIVTRNKPIKSQER